MVRWRTLTIGAAAVAVLAAGSGIGAWAGWTTGSASFTGNATGAQIPVLAPPLVKLSGGKPEITWTPVSSALPIDGYVIRRSTGGRLEVVCDLAATVTKCVDTSATAGGTVRYLAHATLGGQWAGPDSSPSKPILIPAAEAGPAAGSSEEAAAARPAAPATSAVTPATPPATPATPAAAPAISPTVSATPAALSTAAPASSPAAPQQQTGAPSQSGQRRLVLRPVTANPAATAS